MNSKPRYLYRALRLEEIKSGNILIPKEVGPFKANPRVGIDTRIPFQIGETEEYAVRQHQWKQTGFPTSGISTTPYLERAKYYAAKNKVIVKIDRQLLSKYGISEFIVKEWLEKFPEDIAIMEDDEVILVKNTPKSWPTEIVVEIIQLK